MDRKLFVAGATGATGKVLVPLAASRGLSVVPHIRPHHAGTPSAPPNAAAFELADSAALDRALQGCTTVIQLIGTMRKRFARGDTYESSDIGTTRLLVEAGRRGKVDHFLLLSSVGAGRPVGAYLKAKAEAERLVRDSGLPYTIFRPSALEGEARHPPPGMRALTQLFQLRRYEPITLRQLASAMLNVAQARAPLGAVLEGDSLWAQVGRAG